VCSKVPFTFLKRYSRGLETGSKREPAAPTRRIDPPIRQTSTVCGSDLEPNPHPASCGMEPAGHPPRKVAERKRPRPDELSPLVRRTSTVCEPDPETHLHPRSRAMEPAGRPHGKIAKGTEREVVNERSPKNHAHWLIVVSGLDQARSLVRRSTTPHPAARSHPRPAFGCRSKGD
jgi:hypothetical protein